MRLIGNFQERPVKMLRSIIMGVAGCGKSSVGASLSAQINIRYVDGDDLHPAENIEKMSAGIPLTDADRAPWLREVGALLASSDSGLMVGCSALKRQYRDIIRDVAGGPVFFLHLHGARSLIEERMDQRSGHFMPTALLDSQFEALQFLGTDELGGQVDIAGPLEDVAKRSAELIRSTGLID